MVWSIWRHWVCCGIGYKWSQTKKKFGLNSRTNCCDGCTKRRAFKTGVWWPSAWPASTASPEKAPNSAVNGILETMQIREPHQPGNSQGRVDCRGGAKVGAAARWDRKQMVGDRAGHTRQVIPSPCRSDNCIKNHFYSKLRKVLRKLNAVIHANFRREFREISISVVYKLVEGCE